jgi:uncharacterized protein YjiS (DUF1127 family)
MNRPADICEDGFTRRWTGVPHYRTNLRRHPATVAAQAAVLLLQLLSGAAVALVYWPVDRAEAFLRWRERNRQRRVFDLMDDHMLKDIGLTRCDLYDDLWRHRRMK